MADADQASQVSVACDEAIAVISLDRPPVNALNIGLCQDIAAAFAGVADRRDIGAIILTGRGKCFCAGKDIKAAVAESSEARSRALANAMRAVYRCPVPVIAAVNGAAIGAGFRLALLADIVVSSERAVFAMPEIDLGIMPSFAALIRGFGQQHARELAFIGRRYTAAEVHRMGFGSAVVSADELLSESMSRARAITSKDPAAIRRARRLANDVETFLGDIERAHETFEADR